MAPYSDGDALVFGLIVLVPVGILLTIISWFLSREAGRGNWLARLVTGTTALVLTLENILWISVVVMEGWPSLAAMHLVIFLITLPSILWIFGLPVRRFFRWSVASALVILTASVVLLARMSG